MDFNRLFCRSNVHVTHTILIATKLASAIKSVPAVFAQAFAPATARVAVLAA